MQFDRLYIDISISPLTQIIEDLKYNEIKSLVYTYNNGTQDFVSCFISYQ